MDPDVVLARIREGAKAVDDPELQGNDEWEAMADALGEFEALDEWLSKGGFPPKAWAQHRPVELGL